VNGTLLAKVERRLLRPNMELLVSIVTPWEIAIKSELKKSGFAGNLVEAKIIEWARDCFRSRFRILLRSTAFLSITTILSTAC
jgi:hypothetical protein